MNLRDIFWWLVELLTKHRKKVVIWAPAIKRLPIKIVKWWNGKKIAVVGPVAAGKTSLFSRLRGEPVSESHGSTKGVEKVEKFTFEMPLGNGKPFKLFCKRAVDIGGGTDERERAWLVACRGADVIFYVVDINDLPSGAYQRGGRIHDDVRWLAVQISKLKRAPLVHVLANKLDMLVDGNGNLDALTKKIQPTLDDFQRQTESLFGAYRSRLTGCSAISLKDEHLFAITFPKALEAVYEAEPR